VGGVLAEVHREHGVNMVTRDRVAAFEGSGHVERVVTANGERLDCDFVVLGLGVEPVTDWLATCGVELGNGVVVDELCRTNLPGVFAAGDVANHLHPVYGRRVRVEHWQHAIKHGEAAARSMMGKGAPYRDVHWFWSDQYDHNLQYVGHAVAWDEIVLRGSLEQRSFVAFYVKDGIVEAVAGLDRGRDVRRARDLVRARRPVDAALLRDPEVDLKALAQDAAANVTDESAST
jgi:3-phenylpropionate/trans-cinnamate dioxygenase ferredoxin reductase component